MSSAAAAMLSEPGATMDTEGAREGVMVANVSPLDNSPQLREVELEDGTSDKVSVRIAESGNIIEDSAKADTGHQMEDQLKNPNNFIAPQIEEVDDSSVGVYSSDEDEQEYIPSRLGGFKLAVRVMNVEQFTKGVHRRQIPHIVDVLYGGISLKADIDEERARLENSSKVHREKVQGEEISEVQEDQRKPVQSDVGMDVLRRIRIYSPYILQHLDQAADQPSSRPCPPETFSRPFKVLIHRQPQMKKALEQLEKKWGELDSTLQSANLEGHKFEEKTTASSNFLFDNKYCLFHMRVYVKFMEEEVMPLYSMFSGPGLGPHTVLFTDLWYLFREGELVYSPVPEQTKRSTDYESTVSNQALQASYQNCWRVCSIAIAEMPFELDSGLEYVEKSGTRESAVFRYAKDVEATSAILCYYIDYDGESYRPVTHWFRIPEFDGERDIRSLPVYPMRFANEENAFLRAQMTNGENFKKYIERKHLYHRGWTLTFGTIGEPLDGIDKYPEHIEGQVIVDFAEAYQTITSWKPEFRNPDISQGVKYQNNTVPGTRDYRDDEMREARRRRFAPPRPVPPPPPHPIVLSLDPTDDVEIRRRNGFISDDEFISNDGFLSAVRRGEDVNVSGESLAILPKRLVVYSLMQRKFIHANINCLRVIESDPEVFNKLSINTNHKLLVRSLVREHFRKKKRRHEGQEIQYQDFINGKGTGLVFLLHGVPGVGKTATAEAVAQENSKPLFSITCGDLGFEPEHLEKNLSRIFRLANLWDCILLLDEADIFFTKRTPTDLQRNALVAVFLRILEYYSGILFLTTNRVGIIDEAFKSRIHVSLYYPPLNVNQYRQIFELNINRIKEIEAANRENGEPGLFVDGPSILEWCMQHFYDTQNEVGRWNGRQIKNAFQVGASLAQYDLLDCEVSNKKPGIDASKPAILSAAQFAVVAQATQEFDDYMAQAKRGTDSALARKDGVRSEMKAGLYQYHEASHPTGASPQGPSSRPGPGGPYLQPPGSLRYATSREAYREPSSNVYRPEPYEQPLPPQRPLQESSLSTAYSHTPPSQGRQIGDRRERDIRIDGLGGVGQPSTDEGGHAYGRGAYDQQPQETYRPPSSGARGEKFRGGEGWREGCYSNANMGEMLYR